MYEVAQSILARLGPIAWKPTYMQFEKKILAYIIDKNANLSSEFEILNCFYYTKIIGITALSVFVKLLFFGEYTQNTMPTSKIKMKRLAHYFLAIIAGEISSNPSIRSSCPGRTIG